MILVTGASGTVGTEVVKALVARRAPVRAGYRTRPQNVPAGVESAALDYDRAETLAPALRGVESVFLLSSTTSPAELLEREARVVDEAKRAGVKRVVKLSVIGAPEGRFQVARWHRPVEQYVEASGLAWTHLRPNGFMQNLFNYKGDTLRGQSALYAAVGDAAVSHVDARDIGAAAARVLTEGGHEGKAYDLTGPAALTYGQIAEALTTALGRAVRYVPITVEQYKAGALAAGVPEVYADALADLDRAYAEGIASRLADGVRTLTGRDPISFDAFARDYAPSMR
ncbi:MAG: SDR family oxidoreductase [Vicinamibacteria bacterium]